MVRDDPDIFVGRPCYALAIPLDEVMQIVEAEQAKREGESKDVSMGCACSGIPLMQSLYHALWMRTEGKERLWSRCTLFEMVARQPSSKETLPSRL